MKPITHKQAFQWIHRRLDGLLNEDQLLSLEKHLRSCDTCRAYAINMDGLSAHLQNEFHRHWDTQPGPSQNVFEYVTTRAGAIPMANRISSGVKLLTGAMALIVLGIAINFVVSQLQSSAPLTNATETVDNSALATDRLLAFTSDHNGNLDIYTMRADGSEVTNITNSPATDRNPFWSPDGKHIAFESDRNGFIQIFVMNADGSSVFQVTDGETDHKFENLNPWSPDGSRLLFNEKTPNNDKWLLSSIGVRGQNKTQLTNVPDIYSAPSWSRDGQHVAYIIVEPVGDRDMARIHVVDAHGNGDTNVTNILPADEDLYSWNYSWTREGNISFIAGRVSWENNNGKFAYYEATIDGATLAEIAKTSTALEDYWDGTMFIRGFGDTLTWLRADGTYSEFKPYENCQKGDETQSRGFYSKRSSNGYLLFDAACPNGDQWLYWSNPKGTTTKPLFESPIPITEGGVDGIYWSPDGGYAALTISSAGETSLYIVDIREALKAPLALPKSTVLGRNDIAYNIAWQPKP